MRILLVSTLKRNVAADQFASRSRIIFQLGKGLVKKGHTVSLLGTADSHIPGVTTIPVTKAGWEALPPVENPFARDIATLTNQTKQMLSIQHKFDIIHNHTFPDFFPHIVDELLKVPLVTTLHGTPEPYFDETLALFHKSYFIALSQGFAKQLIKTRPFGVVYNGIDTSLYAYQEKKGDYLLWVGRLNASKNAKGVYVDPKGARWAIALAEKTGTPLKLTGSIHDRKAFETDVASHLGNGIEWVGEITSGQPFSAEEIVSLMQNAKAFLMTVNQEEPFGLVMAEAMSCGTPVIGFNRGSVAEIVEDEKTGFVVDPVSGVEGLSNALDKIDAIAPFDCRKRVEENFSIEKMVENYEKAYKEIIRDFRGVYTGR